MLLPEHNRGMLVANVVMRFQDTVVGSVDFFGYFHDHIATCIGTAGATVDSAGSVITFSELFESVLNIAITNAYASASYSDISGEGSVHSCASEAVLDC